jgi:hypothetical protein
MIVATRYATQVIPLLGLTATDTVLLVGAAYGWEVEAFKAALPGITCVGTETSSYIHSVAAETETLELRTIISLAGLDPDTGEGAAILAEIDDGGIRMRETVLNEGLQNNGSRNRVKNSWGGGNADWAISMQVLPWITDQEALDLSANMHLVANNVAHLTRPFLPNRGPEPEPLWNWKTGPDWKLFLPNDTIITDPGNTLEMF